MKSAKRILYSLILTLMFVFLSPNHFSLPTAAANTESSITLNQSSLTLIKGQSFTLKLKGISGKIKWSSKKTSIASVTKKGKVIAKKAGKTTITASINGEKFDCKVTVENPKLSNKTATLKVGQSKVLSLKGTSQVITWKSSNKNIVSVNSSGKITAKKAGKVTITATVLKKKYKCVVTVKKAATSSKKPSNTVTKPSKPSSNYVYVTSSGKKYHRSSACSNMRSPIQVSLSDAINSGRGPCSKCY